MKDGGGRVEAFVGVVSVAMAAVEAIGVWDTVLTMGSCWMLAALS